MRKLYAGLAALLLAFTAHAQVKISALPAGAALAGTEEIPAVQSAATVKTTPAAIQTYIRSTATPVASGGTGAVTLTGIIKGNGTLAFTAGTVALASEVSGTLPVANGGTGVTSSTGTGSVVLSASPTLTGTATVATLAATAATVGGSAVCRADGTNCPAGGTPGGSTTQVQFNNAGAFAGDADYTWDSSGNRLNIGSLGTAGRLGGPDATTTTANGAALTVRSGAGGTVSGNGGDLSLLSGFPQGDGNTGAVTLSAGSAVGTNRTGGSVTVSGGNSTGNVTGGNATIQAGGNNSGTGAGGAAQLIGGTSTSATGGAAVVRGGTAVTTGTGGGASITGGAGVGTNQNGGDVTIQPGAATGSGVQGKIVVVNATGTGAQTATGLTGVTNKPGAGTTAPSLWVTFRVGGTDYYIPMWQ